MSFAREQLEKMAQDFGKAWEQNPRGISVEDAELFQKSIRSGDPALMVLVELVVNSESNDNVMKEIEERWKQKQQQWQKPEEEQKQQAK